MEFDDEARTKTGNGIPYRVPACALRHIGISTIQFASRTVSIACHPHHRTTRRLEVSTCYLWDHREELAGRRATRNQAR